MSAATGYPMRLSFPNGEHADVVVDSGVISLGSSEDNTISLKSAGVSPWHARVSADQRGAVLEVLDPAARTHVNARPVREKAILRLGDVLNLDAVSIVIKPDRDDRIDQTVPASAAGDGSTRMRQLPPRVVLRGVSGQYFGKVIPVSGRLVIGRSAECDLVLDEQEMSRRHAMVENVGDGIYLRDLGSANGTYVNGVQVKDAVLHSGDQIAFDRNRFLLEAPGLPLRGQTDRTASASPAITQTMQAVNLPAADAPGTTSRSGIWWLIGVAALIGLGLAALLLTGT